RLIRRETPYGEPARGGKRSLYKIDDCFLRLWFRVVAPDRAALTTGTPASRRAILDAHWDQLVGPAWEDLCRLATPSQRGAVARLGPWRPPQRFWHGNEPEWDLVADAVCGPRTLVGEAWFAQSPVAARAVARECGRLAAKALPTILGDR